MNGTSGTEVAIIQVTSVDELSNVKLTLRQTLNRPRKRGQVHGKQLE